MPPTATEAPPYKESILAFLGPRIAVRRDISRAQEGSIHIPDQARVYENTGTIVFAGTATPLVQHLMAATSDKDRSNAIFHLLCHNPDAVGSGFTPGMRIVFEDMEAHKMNIGGEELWVMMDVSVVAVLSSPDQAKQAPENEENVEPDGVAGRIG